MRLSRPPSAAITVVAALGILTVIASGSVGFQVTDAGGRVDEYLSRLAPFGFSGSVLVAQGGKVALEKGYGLANRQNSTPYTAATVSTIGSITKMFTAAAILKLEMQGHLRVEDSIAKYLPDVPPDKSAITIHQLLTHTGGLRADYGGRDTDPISRDDLVSRVLTTPLASAPGARHEYSNEGYSLLGAIVERVSGESYEQYLRENVLQPAGMNDTGYVLPRWNAERIAHGYAEGADWGTMAEKGWGAEGPGWFLKANGGLHSTVGDLYRWHLALQTDRVLSAAAREKYTKPYVAEGPQARSYYAYGWAVFTTARNTKLVAHNGGNGVFAADFRRYVDEQTVVIAMSNGEVSAIDVTPVLDAVIFGRPYVTPPPVEQAARGALAPLAGQYAVPSGGTISVSVDGEGLRFETDDPQAFALLNFLDAPGDPRFAEVEKRSRAIVEGGARGDFAAVREAMGTDRPLERIRQNQGAMWKERRERIGEVRGVEVLGSGRGPAGRIVYVRIAGERGSELVQFGWEDGEMMMMRPLQTTPGARLLLSPANGKGRDAGFRVFSGFRLPDKLVQARFEMGRDGTVMNVFLEQGTRTLRAKMR